MYTKVIAATRKFKRRKAFIGFENETCRMDLAGVNKLARNKNGVNYLLVHPDLFDRPIDAKGMETKDSKETVCAFWLRLQKRIDPKKFGSIKEQSLLQSS